MEKNGTEPILPEEDPKVVRGVAEGMLRVLRDVRHTLRSRGPLVNLYRVNLYVAGRITDEKEAAEIGRNIVTWREWHEAYWDAVHGQWAAERIRRKQNGEAAGDAV